MLLVDAFDRDVERNFYCSAVENSLLLHTTMGRLYSIVSIRRLLDNPDFTNNLKGELDTVINQLTAFAGKKQAATQHMAALLIQCPASSDPVS